LVRHGAKREQLLDKFMTNTPDTENFTDWGTHFDEGSGEQADYVD
jgi:hypothetical protein